MPRLCRCGAIVEGRCERCSPPVQHSETTKQRGYGHDWRQLSERFRIENPLCQLCEMEHRIRPATQVHHIKKIVDAQHKRLDQDNLLAVCDDCHGVVEEDTELAKRAKKHGRQC
jgi:5-methylcytosine-specific restriction endonuclease McrA